jgi:hypothetical protein
VGFEQTWILVDCVIGGKEGLDEFVGVGGLCAALQVGAGEVAPDRGILWIERCGLGEIRDGTVDLAGEERHDSIATEIFGSGFPLNGVRICLGDTLRRSIQGTSGTWRRGFLPRGAH